MRLANDYFLEDFLDLFVIDSTKIIVTYDTLFHQSLEKYLNGKNLIVHGSKLKTTFLFDNKMWHQFTNCKITYISQYGNFISYTIQSDRVENDGNSIHVKRKIKIKSLLQ